MKKTVQITLVTLFAAVIIFSCKTTETGTGSNSFSQKAEKTGYADMVRSIPAKNFLSYTFSPDTELIKRLQDPPDFFLAYLKEMDGNPAYTFYHPDQTGEFIIDFALKNLPHSFRSILEDRLLGIYFVNDFLGSGMADYVLDKNNNMYYTLTFNPKVLSMSMTELVSFRENSCFIQDDPSISIEVQLSDEAPGFFYILMHEAAHIIDYHDRYTPFVEPGMEEISGRIGAPTPFTDGVWKDYFRLVNEDVFPYSSRITFYGMGGGPSIPISEAVDVYRALEAFPIASLYGTKSWAEDFAEMAAFVYLVENMQIGYRIAVLREGVEMYTWEPLSSSGIVERAGTVRPLFY